MCRALLLCLHDVRRDSSSLAPVDSRQLLRDRVTPTYNIKRCIICLLTVLPPYTYSVAEILCSVLRKNNFYWSQNSLFLYCSYIDIFFFCYGNIFITLMRINMLIAHFQLLSVCVLPTFHHNVRFFTFYCLLQVYRMDNKTEPTTTKTRAVDTI